jgi:hypothetical protein
MVSKLAIFVEGQTEQIFVDKLLEEIIGSQKLRTSPRRARGGSAYKRRITRLSASNHDTGQKYYVLIVDCGADNRVKSDIMNEYDSLAKNGYRAIIGIRDVRPENRADLPRLRARLAYGLKMVPIGVTIVLAVMEVEAWFLAEHTHLSRIDGRLDCVHIQSALGFDPSRDDMEGRDRPADDLAQVYGLAGKTYSKNKNTVERTVNVLDYGRLYLEIPGQMPSLEELVAAINAFLGHS